jgi:hypothetical protein
LDRDDRELFAYHWHPKGLSPVVHPHLHLTRVSPFLLPAHGSHKSLELPIDKAHFPTGHVTLQQVSRLLIEDLGVEPARRIGSKSSNQRPDSPSATTSLLDLTSHLLFPISYCLLPIAFCLLPPPVIFFAAHRLPLHGSTIIHCGSHPDRCYRRARSWMAGHAQVAQAATLDCIG